MAERFEERRLAAGRQGVLEAALDRAEPRACTIGIGGVDNQSVRIARCTTTAGPAELGGADRRRNGHIHHLSAGETEVGDGTDEALPRGVLEVEHLGERPVIVGTDEGELVLERMLAVGHDSPRRPPVRSTVNSLPHAGQSTSARAWPSWLTRR